MVAVGAKSQASPNPLTYSLMKKTFTTFIIDTILNILVLKYIGKYVGCHRFVCCALFNRLYFTFALENTLKI